MKTQKYIIQSVERAFRIVDYICSNESPTLSDIAAKFELSTNTAFRLLKSLVSSGYIKQSREGVFSLTLKVLPLATVALNQLEIRKHAIHHLQTLWGRYPKANANLAVLEQGDVIAVARIESQEVLRTYYHIGRTRPAHATGLGKALISESSDEELEGILKSDTLVRYTDHTIGTLSDLKRELEKVRNEKVAWDRGEYIPGVLCIAAPVRGQSGKIVAAISLSALEHHMSEADLMETIPSLLECARNISEAMGY